MGLDHCEASTYHLWVLELEFPIRSAFFMAKFLFLQKNKVPLKKRLSF